MSHPQPSSRYTPPQHAAAGYSPAEREAGRMDGDGADKVQIDWGGVAMFVPMPEEMDLDVLESFETGKAIGTMREIFGAAAFADARREFEQRNGRRPKIKDLNALVESVFDIWGIKPGE